MGEQVSVDGIFRTWQPEFLVFGKTNEHLNKFSINRIDGIYFSLELGRKMYSSFRLSYQFRQYVPINIKYTDKKSPVGNASSAGRRSDRSVYGGGQHILQLRIGI
jgi:hypothetical protein